MSLSDIQRKAHLFSVRVRLQRDLRPLADKPAEPLRIESIDEIDPAETSSIGFIRTALGCDGRTWS